MVRKTAIEELILATNTAHFGASASKNADQSDSPQNLHMAVGGLVKVNLLVSFTFLQTIIVKS